jgi:large subunit ribosomal protein L17
MMRNMVTSILENGEVTCTLARAKEVRAPLEKMITFAKQGDLHSRRQVLRFVKSKLAMENLFGEIAERYKERPGGYCRVIKLAKRRLGDASEMAIVQLVGSENDALSALKKSNSRNKAVKPQPSLSLLDEVSTQVNEPKAEAQIEKTA